MLTQIKLQEIKQGKKIRDCAERTWGWATPAGIFRVSRRVDEFIHYLNTDKKSKVLEIGCGTGIFTNNFYQRGICPIGIDISLDLLKKAKERNPRIIFIQADAENLPFKENVFDFVLGISVLHHLAIRDALKSIKSVLKAGGKIIFSEPNGINPQIFFQKRIDRIKKLVLDTPFESAFSRWQIENTLSTSGFEQISARPYEFLHPLTPKIFINFIRRIEYCIERIPFIKEMGGSLLIFAKKKSK